MLTPPKNRRGGGNPQQGCTRIIGQCICCIIQKLNPEPCDAVPALVGAVGFINYSETKRLWPNLRCYPSI